MAWPPSVEQVFIQNGFSYLPRDNAVESPTDHGIKQVRPRFTGRLAEISGQIWVEDMDEADAIMSFYYNEVGVHTYFNFLNPFYYVGSSMEQVVSVRFMQPPKLTPRGGAGFILSTRFERAPFTVGNF